MKKILALVVLLAILATTAASAAEIDLAGMTFDELRALQTQLNQEIHNRPEWKEVTVPAGDWVVGEDIPAGAYSVCITDPDTLVGVIVWGSAKDDYESDGGLLYNILLMDDTLVYGKLKLAPGNIVAISGPVIFAPAVSLGF